jgi:hypothetical protein
MDILFFSSALNIHTQAADSKVLRWAWEKGLFENPAELERCRQQKINWFAGYLFPESQEEKLLEIMKFFLGLFLLDDLTDVQTDKSHLLVLERLKNSVRIDSSHRLDRLSAALIDLKGNLSKYFTADHAAIEWEEAWHNYLNGLLWEVKNKLNRKLPSLEEYRYLRPFASGVFLAILLARGEGHLKECRTELLELELSRFICLANDISSFEKEFLKGEFHNEVFIQSQSMGADALIWAKKELQMQGKRIYTLSTMIALKLTACADWIRRLHLLVGGCLAWTELTTRYQAHVNGKSTPNA